MRIDLHSHTYYSDGSLSPKESVRLILKRKVRYLAITDHNTVDGVKEAVRAAKNKNIEIIPGIEFDTSVKCSKDTIHLVGLYLNTKSKELNKIIKKLAIAKRKKNKLRIKIVNKHFKSNITNKDIEAKTKGVPGSPHLARVLLEKGYVKTIQEGIKLLLKGGPCFINIANKRVSAKEGIRAIHKAGGTAILAHISAYKYENKFKTPKAQEKLIKELKSYGLDALEIYIVGATKKEKAFGEKMAKKYNLKLSGGSDFHDESFIKHNKLGVININKSKMSVLRD